MLKLTPLRVASFVFFFFSSASYAEPNCDQALVKSTYNLSKTVGIDWRLADLVTKEMYDEIKHSASGSAVIYGVPVGADYNDYRNRVDKLNAEHREHLSYSQKVNIAWTGLDPKAPSAYRDCLNTQVFLSTGFHAAVLGATEENISILLKWNVPGIPGASVKWVGVDKKMAGARTDTASQLPRSVSQGEVTVVVPRPKRQTSIAGNASVRAGSYTTQAIILEPLPPPPPVAQWKRFTYGDEPTLDGQGYKVGDISHIALSVLVDESSKGSAKLPYRFSYDYYNGSGTWRGSQSINVVLVGNNEVALGTIPVGLDRGRCVYGRAEPREQKGETTLIEGALIKGIRVQVGRVSGIQTRC